MLAAIENNETVRSESNGSQPLITISPSSLIWDHLSTNKLAICVALSIGLVSSIASFGLTLVVGNFFVLQFHTEGTKNRLIHHLGINTNTLQNFFVLFSILILIKVIAAYIETYVVKLQGEIFARNIRERLFKSQMQWSAEKFSQKQYGYYLLRYSNDQKAIQQLLTKGMLGGIKEIIFFSLGLFLLVKISLLLTLATFTVFVTSCLIILYLYNIQKKLIEKSRSDRSSLLSFVTKNFSRFKKIKLECSEEKAIVRFDSKSRQLFLSNKKNILLESFTDSIINVMQFLMIGIVLWLLHITEIVITSNDALIFVLILMLTQGSIRRSLKAPSYINKGLISLRKSARIIQVNR